MFCISCKTHLLSYPFRILLNFLRIVLYQIFPICKKDIFACLCMEHLSFYQFVTGKCFTIDKKGKKTWPVDSYFINSFIPFSPWLQWIRVVSSI